MSGGGENDSVLIQVDGEVAILTLNRPEAMNSWTTEMALRFNAIMSELNCELKIRVVVITGAGSRAFSVGADLKERNGMSPNEWRHQHDVFEEKNRLIRECPKPVIGAINGFAVGGGLEIALSMDYLFAAQRAMFGLAEVRRGIIPGGGGTQLLPRRIPLGAATEMLITGRFIDSAEAQRLGLVNAVFSDDELLPRVLERAKLVAASSPTAVRQVRTSLRLGLHLSMDDALAVELACYQTMIDHPDRLEGVAAFVEKRAANFLDCPAEVS